MCDDKILAALHHLIGVTESDDYEYGRVLTVGGTTGNYKFRSPWNTECEWACIGATASNPGNFLISYSPGANLPATNGTASYGLNSSGGESNAIDGIFGLLTTSDIYVPSLVWQPLPSPGDLYAQITASANQSLFVSVAFRRKLARYIPDMPVPVSPHRPIVLRQNRRTMMAGFEKARYPDYATGYEHPAFSVPEPSQPDFAGSGEIGPRYGAPALPAIPLDKLRAYRRNNG